MIVIDNKEVVFSTTIIVADDVEVEISNVLANWPYQFRLVFKPNDGISPNYIFTPTGNVLKMEFKCWNNSLGSSLINPVKIGTYHDGRNLGVMVFQHKAGNMNRVDFQILLGGIYA